MLAIPLIVPLDFFRIFPGKDADSTFFFQQNKPAVSEDQLVMIPYSDGILSLASMNFLYLRLILKLPRLYSLGRISRDLRLRFIR